MWHGRNGDCCALAGVGKCKWLGMFAWSATLKYIVKSNIYVNRKHYVCMLCMFPACAVTFLVHDYVTQ